MVINDKNWASVAVVDDKDFVLAVLSDEECVCANNLRVIAESDDGGLVFEPQGDSTVKCFIRKKDVPLKEGQLSTHDYIAMIRRSPDTEIDPEEVNYNVVKGNLGVENSSNIMDIISKLPPQMIELAIKNIIGNTAAFKQNQKNAKKKEEQEKAEEPANEKNDKQEETKEKKKTKKQVNKKEDKDKNE